MTDTQNPEIPTLIGDDFRALSDSDIATLIVGREYCLATTGAEVVANLVLEASSGAYLRGHGLTDERMVRVIYAVGEMLADRLDVPALRKG